MMFYSSRTHELPMGRQPWSIIWPRWWRRNIRTCCSLLKSCLTWRGHLEVRQSPRHIHITVNISFMAEIGFQRIEFEFPFFWTSLFLFIFAWHLAMFLIKQKLLFAIKAKKNTQPNA